MESKKYNNIHIFGLKIQNYFLYNILRVNNKFALFLLYVKKKVLSNINILLINIRADVGLLDTKKDMMCLSYLNYYDNLSVKQSS